MAFVTVMLTTQPTFITGIHDYDAARSSALGAMMAFGVTFGLSVFILVRNSKKNGEGHFGGGATGSIVGGAGGGEVDYDDRLNIDLRRNYGEKKVYGSVATDSY